MTYVSAFSLGGELQIVGAAGPLAMIAEERGPREIAIYQESRRSPAASPGSVPRYAIQKQARPVAGGVAPMSQALVEDKVPLPLAGRERNQKSPGMSDRGKSTAIVDLRA